jgi:hypothetical protein
VDNVSLPDDMRQAVYDLLPHAKKAWMKSGGDFPFLSRADEFSMFLLVSAKINHYVI